MRWLISIAFTFCSLLFFGQEHAILSKFTAEYTGNEVILNWTIKGGQQCNGVDVYRSVDSINWEKIGGVEGICGASEPQYYDFTDSDPEKGNFNYYQLKLGTQGFSSIQKIQVIRYEDSYAVYPNPGNDIITLSISPNLGRGRYLIYNPLGTLVHTAEVDAGELLTLQKATYGSGIFIFQWVSENNQQVNGSFIFQ